MIGAHFAATSVFCRPKEARTCTSVGVITSSTTKETTSSLVVTKQPRSKSLEEANFPRVSSGTTSRVLVTKQTGSESVEDVNFPTKSRGSTSRIVTTGHTRSNSQADTNFPTEGCRRASYQLQSNDQIVIGNQTNTSSVLQSISSVSCLVNKNNEMDVSLPTTVLQTSTQSQRSYRPVSAEKFQKSYDLAIKIILLGDYCVGKTSFLRTLSRVKDEDVSGCCKEFRDGEMADVVYKKDGKRILVRIMDTGGQERYRSVTSSYYRGVHGCLLVFDVSREDTFNNIMNW